MQDVHVWLVLVLRLVLKFLVMAKLNFTAAFTVN